MLAVAGLVLAAAACSGSDGDSAGAAPEAVDEVEREGRGFDGPVTVIVANSPGTLSTVGPQRVMTALVGDGPNTYLGGPDEPVSIRFAPAGDQAGGGAGATVEGEWLTTDASTLGLYVAAFTFDDPGPWEVTALAGDHELGRTLIEVVTRSTVPGLGDQAPRSSTPTASTAEEIEAISTDTEPVPAFYRLSIADAVANGRPTVVAFVTPAFCQTALCGPTLDIVKEATAGRDGLDVVHVEPFDVARAREGSLEPVPTMAEWGLVTEPWVFVIDADGLVVASFEGIIGLDELERSLDRL